MDYMTIKQAAEFSKKGWQSLYKAYLDGKIDGYQAESGHHKIYLERDSLKSYLDNPTTKKGAWGNIHGNSKRAFYKIDGYDYAYATTSDGGVVNITTGTEIIPVAINEAGYMQVTLIKDGKHKNEYVHRLVMQSQGYNNRNKSAIHHINQNPKDNRISNLLAVWPSEHQKLHKLLKDGAKDEYQKLVKEIKAQNKEQIYKIPHPDFGERFCMYLDRAGYKAYLAGEQIPYDSIRGEFELWGSPTKPKDFSFEFDKLRKGA